MSSDSTIEGRLTAVRDSLPAGVTLVAVSKFHPEEQLLEAYQAGQRVFGESHVQEMVRKHEQLPADIEWHFIGHLQTNKVKYIAPFVSMIEAVDSWRLLTEIEKHAAKCGRVIPVLLEVHVAQEETKYGWSAEELRSMLAGGEWRQLEHVRIDGLMAMATFTDDEEQVRREFGTARRLFEELKSEFFASAAHFCRCSWGMSDDYPIAVQCGSNMVRIGTRIFGSRGY